MFFPIKVKKNNSSWVERMRKLKKFIQQHPYTLTYQVYSKNPTSFFAEEEFKVVSKK
jgi:hypothetical protein